MSISMIWVHTGATIQIWKRLIYLTSLYKEKIIRF